MKRDKLKVDPEQIRRIREDLNNVEKRLEKINTDITESRKKQN